MAISTNKNLRNKVIYQVFTRNYKDGTFKSLEADLSRIKSLGTDIVYLLPVQPNGVLHRKGSIGSPYAISDYRAVDPRQGTMDDFIHLADAIHAHGMELMIDVVYNHTSPDSWLAQNHPEWFYHKADGSFGNRIGDWWDVIDLNYSHKGLWDYQIETLNMWAKYVDGFRCDVAPLVPVEFWKAARKSIAQVRPNCLWMAESIEHHFITGCRANGIKAASDSEMYQAFDICYDYDIYNLQAAILKGETSLDNYLHHVNMQEAIFPDNYVKMRCLENHDRPRAAGVVTNMQQLRNWTAWIYFLKGATMLYNGQEYCNNHQPTLFEMDPISFSTGKDISAFMAKLGKIKKAPVFTDSAFSANAIGDDNKVIFARHTAYAGASIEKQHAVGIFSTTLQKQELMVDMPDGHYTNEITGEKLQVANGKLSYNAEPVIIIY